MARGDGRVYRKKRKDGTFYGGWVLQYYNRGRRVLEYSGLRKEADARKLLKVRQSEVIRGEFTALPGKVRISDLYESLVLSVPNRSKKSAQEVKYRWAHLRAPFQDLLASELTTDRLQQYVSARLKASAAIATVNRELALLRRMLRLGQRCSPPKVRAVPFFPMLRENNTRKGFVEEGAFTRLAFACEQEGLWLRAMLEVGYCLGWRVSEITSMRVSQVDLIHRILRLEPGTTKNKEGREADMPRLMATLIEQCVQGKKPDDYVFTRTHGAAVRDFRAAWAKVTRLAGVPGLLFHDLRRTAVRNMLRDGTDEKTAMSITGHKTREVFERYHIIDGRDRKRAAERMDLRSAPATAPIEQKPDAPEPPALTDKVQ